METSEEVVKAFKELREHDRRLERRVLIANLVFAFVILLGVLNYSTITLSACSGQ